MALAEHFLRSGKVRDLYELGDGRLLLVASDRISAFDVVLPTPIPDKGRVLTGLSRHWFARPTRSSRTTSSGRDTADPRVARSRDALSPDEGRPDRGGGARLSRGFRLEGLPGATGEICGVPLPAGLIESGRLPEPTFTPSTKAEPGEHDENIGFDAMALTVGARPRDARSRPFAGAVCVRRRGDRARQASSWPIPSSSSAIDEATGELLLIDEALTPDSSRFWDASTYEPGRPQASFDKQFVRDWLETQPWDKTAPGPALPDDVVAGTRARYVEAYERITGASFERYLQEDVIAS